MDQQVLHPRSAGDERFAAKTFTDYMLEGPLAALDAIEAQLSALEERMNAKGYLDGHDMAAGFKVLRATSSIRGYGRTAPSASNVPLISRRGDKRAGCNARRGLFRGDRGTR